MKLMTKSEAKLFNLNTYFTGKPCKRNHVDVRYVSDNQCKTCKREASVAKRKTKEGQEYIKKWLAKNQDKVKQHIKKYSLTEKGRQTRAKANKNWRQRETSKETLKRCRKRYKATHRERLKVCTPKWASKNKIKNIYTKCPEGHHVDHIVPLLGKNVCGLHVENNLQYLEAKENIRKGNQF